jgi:hypothetical protein
MYAEFWWEQLKEREGSERLGRVGKILKGILKYWDGKAYSGLNWLSI